VMAARKVGGGTGNRGKGRKKGVPNKTTASVKEAITLAFEGIGGVPKLIRWANANETEFYKLWGRLVPHEVTGAGGGPLGIKVVFEDIKPDP
jgi:hypothetical protein